MRAAGATETLETASESRNLLVTWCADVRVRMHHFFVAERGFFVNPCQTSPPRTRTSLASPGGGLVDERHERLYVQAVARGFRREVLREHSLLQARFEAEAGEQKAQADGPLERRQ